MISRRTLSLGILAAAAFPLQSLAHSEPPKRDTSAVLKERWLSVPR